MRLVFLGPPGAGKGTLAVLVGRKLGIPTVSTGDLFREGIKKGTPLGVRVKEIVAAGDLVPDELTVGLVKERLGREDARSGFILDGFPRTVAQAEALERLQALDAVVNLVVSDEEVVKRLSTRRVCCSCGASRSGGMTRRIRSPIGSTSTRSRPLPSSASTAGAASSKTSIPP
jgi:adenylate kinase